MVLPAGHTVHPFRGDKVILERDMSRVCWLKQMAACLWLHECKAGWPVLVGFRSWSYRTCAKLRRPCSLRKWGNTYRHSLLIPDSVYQAEQPALYHSCVAKSC